MTTPVRVRQRTRLTGGNGSVTTSRAVTGQDDVSNTRNFQESLEHPNPAYVGVNQNFTRNMGDYNSIKIGVHVSMPCAPDEDSIRETYEKVSTLVSDFLDEEYEAAVGSGDSE